MRKAREIIRLIILWNTKMWDMFLCSSTYMCINPNLPFNLFQEVTFLPDLNPKSIIIEFLNILSTFPPLFHCIMLILLNHTLVNTTLPILCASIYTAECRWRIHSHTALSHLILLITKFMTQYCCLSIILYWPSPLTLPFSWTIKS